MTRTEQDTRNDNEPMRTSMSLQPNSIIKKKKNDDHKEPSVLFKGEKEFTLDLVKHKQRVIGLKTRF